jgi:hypothetical protein
MIKKHLLLFTTVDISFSSLCDDRSEFKPHPSAFAAKSRSIWAIHHSKVLNIHNSTILDSTSLIFVDFVVCASRFFAPGSNRWGVESPVSVP